MPLDSAGGLSTIWTPTDALRTWRVRLVLKRPGIPVETIRSVADQVRHGADLPTKGA